VIVNYVKKIIKISRYDNQLLRIFPIFCTCGLTEMREVAHPVHKRGDSMRGSQRARRRMFSTCYVKVLNSPCNAVSASGKRRSAIHVQCAHAGTFCETKRPLDKLVNSICFESQHDRVRHATSINSAPTTLCLRLCFRIKIIRRLYI